MLVRFAAAGLVVLSLLELGLYVVDCLGHHRTVQLVHAFLLFLPCLLGIIVFIRARAIAEWIAEKFD